MIALEGRIPEVALEIERLKRILDALNQRVARAELDKQKVDVTCLEGKAERDTQIFLECSAAEGIAVRLPASHIPEVLMTIEEQGWDVDFYAGCVYNIRRTPAELRKLLGGELPESPGDVYLQDDPPRMYQFMRSTKKPCVAYKILGAGRVSNVEAAFKKAFDSLKPTDLVCVGVFPTVKDEVKEDAYYASRYGVAGS